MNEAMEECIKALPPETQIKLNISFTGTRQQRYLPHLNNSSNSVLIMNDDIGFAVRYDQEDLFNNGLYKYLLVKMGKNVHSLTFSGMQPSAFMDQEYDSVSLDFIARHCQRLDKLTTKDTTMTTDTARPSLIINNRITCMVLERVTLPNDNLLESVTKILPGLKNVTVDDCEFQENRLHKSHIVLHNLWNNALNLFSIKR